MTTPVRGFFHACLTNAYKVRGRAGGFASASGAMLSSGSGAFGVSSAISQPPGFTDSPEGTTPDPGRRKRRAKARAVLKSLLAPRPRADPTAVASADTMFVRLNNQTRSGLDLPQRWALEPRSEPSPPLTAWGAACEPGTIRRLTKSRQEADVAPAAEPTNL